VENKKMAEIIKNRSEILFLYDASWINPNGDPIDENKPRVDEETGRNIVTDVRLKRTIRDYFLSLIEKEDNRLKEQDIFIKEVRDENGYLYDAKRRAQDFLKETGDFQKVKEAMQKDILDKCIDIRLFGAVIPIEIKVKDKEKPEEGSITLTGPVQFKFGTSLHEVEPKFVQGTGAFASEYPGLRQFTFREEWVLPYSLILFHGLINENAAKHTQLSEADVDLLFEAMWNGTKNLITRTKIGQMPRLLLQVIYKEGECFHIGSLDNLYLQKDKDDKKLRDIQDVRIDITELVRQLEAYKDKIEKLRYRVDTEVKFIKDGQPIKLENAIPSDIKKETFNF
jgi:CRISPR-associated protein Csh2